MSTPYEANQEQIADLDDAIENAKQELIGVIDVYQTWADPEERILYLFREIRGDMESRALLRWWPE